MSTTNVEVRSALPSNTPDPIEHELGAEAGAHSILRLICDLPGAMERLRTARVIGGFAVPFRGETPPELLDRYAVELGWPLREVIALVDALIDGGLLTQTTGARPMLVLTRAGFMALHALEQVKYAEV